MKKLVVTYVQSDDCTYSFDVVVPVLYESEEKLLVDLEEWAQGYCDIEDFSIRNRYQNFKIDNKSIFTIHNFVYLMDDKLHVCLPEILTLEEWFENKVKIFR